MTQFTSIAAVREFLLSSYHDLPNILFMGSLLLGSIMGYLPLVWLALGLVFNASIIALVQSFVNSIFEENSQIVSSNVSPACQIGYERMSGIKNSAGTTRRIFPSQWMGASTFFAAFSIYNSIKVAVRESAPGARQEHIDNRRAYSLSTFIIGFAFLTLILARAFTGCESLLGGATGVLIGVGLAIGYWHILDACGTGRIPDILQVVRSIAPEAKKDETPVVCRATQ
jgi:hypothetical protein